MNISKIVDLVNQEKIDPRACALVLAGIWQFVKPKFDQEEPVGRGQ